MPTHQQQLWSLQCSVVEIKVGSDSAKPNHDSIITLREREGERGMLWDHVAYCIPPRCKQTWRFGEQRSLSSFSWSLRQCWRSDVMRPVVHWQRPSRHVIDGRHVLPSSQRSVPARTAQHNIVSHRGIVTIITQIHFKSTKTLVQ